MLLNRNEVWRIEASQNARGVQIVTKTLLFKLQIIVDIRSIDVYDDFAFVIFADESVLLAVRPLVDGQFA